MPKKERKQAKGKLIRINFPNYFSPEDFPPGACFCSVCGRMTTPYRAGCEHWETKKDEFIYPGVGQVYAFPG